MVRLRLRRAGIRGIDIFLILSGITDDDVIAKNGYYNVKNIISHSI